MEKFQQYFFFSPAKISLELLEIHRKTDLFLSLRCQWTISHDTKVEFLHKCNLSLMLCTFGKNTKEPEGKNETSELKKLRHNPTMQKIRHYSKEWAENDWSDAMPESARLQMISTSGGKSREREKDFPMSELMRSRIRHELSAWCDNSHTQQITYNKPSHHRIAYMNCRSPSFVIFQDDMATFVRPP